MKKIIDAHCDVLYKMFLDPGLDFYQSTSGLDVTYERMRNAGVKLQFFAIYLPENLKRPTFDHLLEYVDIFRQKVESKGKVAFIRNQHELDAAMSGDEIGAVLSLEGADALAGNPVYTRILYYLGVRFIGITWNYANWAADGILEPRKGGFTRKGRNLIKECNELGMLLDVSHLSVRGFWELAELSQAPFIASHSNVLAICPHPRNLDDQQIRAIIQTDGRIGITFVPRFVKQRGPVSISDVLKHIDHVCSLGGVRHVGFGSDFDGIEEWVTGLEHAGKYEMLAEELTRHYKAEEAEGFLWGNWHRFLKKNFPL
jgi:membrane dipeptidase